MSVGVHLGKRPYSLVWKVRVDDTSRYYESSVFTLEESKWRFVLQTELNPHHGEEDWKVFLRKIHPMEGFHVFLITTYIEDRKKKLECLNFSRINVTKPGTEQILWRRKSNVVLKYPDIVLEGNLTFVFTLLSDYRHLADLENYTDTKSVQTPPYLDIHPCLQSLVMDFRKLLLDSSEADVELHCGDRILQAHRSVLIARSEVFSAMLQSDMLEKSKGFIEIVDIEFPILEHFLRYLYAGTLPELSVELASKLYEASDKYAVEPLMTRCSNFLKENLTDENASCLLVFADTHNDTDFKDFIISYMIRNDVVMNMIEGDELSDCHPKLAIDVLSQAYKMSKISLK